MLIKKMLYGEGLLKTESEDNQPLMEAVYSDKKKKQDRLMFYL